MSERDALEKVELSLCGSVSGRKVGVGAEYEREKRRGKSARRVGAVGIGLPLPLPLPLPLCSHFAPTYTPSHTQTQFCFLQRIPLTRTHLSHCPTHRRNIRRPTPAHTTPARLVMFNRNSTGTLRVASLLFALLVLASADLAAQQEAKGSGSVVLHAARVIDGTGSAPILNGVVLVTDNKIV